MAKVGRTVADQVAPFCPLVQKGEVMNARRVLGRSTGRRAAFLRQPPSRQHGVPVVAALVAVASLLFGVASAGAAGSATIKVVNASGGVQLVVKLPASSSAKPPRRVVVTAGGKSFPLTRAGGGRKGATTWKSAIQKGAAAGRLERLDGKGVKVKVVEQGGRQRTFNALVDVKAGKQEEHPAQPVVTPPIEGPKSSPPPPSEEEQKPPFPPLSAALNLPGPLLESPKEALRFEVTAEDDGAGEAFIGLPDPQPDPTFPENLDPFGIDFTPSPQVGNSGLPGYVTVSASHCAAATVTEVVPNSNAKSGILVSYDCAAGQGFYVNYNPRISYWAFNGFPVEDSWKFSLSQRPNPAQPWTALPSDLGLQVKPTTVELNQNIFINPPAPVVASEEVADGQLKLTTQGFNAEGVKNESSYQTSGYFTLDGEILALKEGAADNLRSVEQAPLEVNGCIWATDPGSELLVTGDDSTDTIHATNLLLNGDVVIFTSKSGGSAVNVGTKYYVINRTPSSFQISADGKTAANLGSDITNPSTVARQTVTPPAAAPPLICEDIYTFGVIKMVPPPSTFEKGDGSYWEVAAWLVVSAAHSNANGWNAPSRECLVAGGSYTDIDGVTPGGTGTADWRCDFPASKGMTHEQLLSVVSQYNSGEICPANQVYLEENYPSGGGADDIWCPLIEVH